MAKIDFEKILIEFLNSPFNRQFDEKLKSALKEQGLEYKDGEIVTKLVDSQDERIRKMLIDSFTRADMGGEIYGKGVTYKQVIAWLEKQGEKKYTEEELQKAYMTADEVMYRRGYEDAKREIEKQGKETSMVVWHSVSEAPNEMEELLCEWESDDATWHDVAFYHADTKTFWNGERKVMDVTRWCYVDELVKKQGEQKDTCNGCNNIKGCVTCVNGDQWAHITEASTVELSDDENPTYKKPKFNVDDWITDGEAVFHITSYDIDYGYQLETQKGTSFHFSDEKVENKYHLWAIQDAKDGDVLDANGAPFIYKKHDKDYVYFYCGVNLEDAFIEATENDIWNSNIKVYPATKEQRDLLFSKMKDACYAWDSDKKEIRKTCQKPNYCHHEVDETGYRKAYYDGWNNCNQQHSQLEAQRKTTWSEKMKLVLLILYGQFNKQEQ